MSEERHAAIVAMLEGNEIESEEEPEELEAQSVEEESDASDVDEPEEEETQVEASSDDDDEYEVEEGHRVPYNRFKQINDQRHALKSQLEERERFIAELEEKIRAKKRPEPSWEDNDEYEEVYDEPNSLEDVDEISYLREQTRAMQVKFATMELEKEIAGALEQYPNVPAEHLWEAIAQDGTQSAVAVAQQYSTWVAGVEEAAIARYLEEQGGEAPDAPPRPKRKQTARSNPSNEEWQPKNTNEAREAMIAYLRS